jgi:PBSX family phage portal protein
MSDKMNNKSKRKGSAFAFGDPEPVNQSTMIDYMGCFYNGEYYLPPWDLGGLSKMRHANPHHGSCLMVRRNYLANHYVPNKYFPLSEFRNAVLDQLTFGIAYIQKVRNFLGNVIRLKHVPALNMRIKMNGTGYRLLKPNVLAEDAYCDFKHEDIIYIKEYDTLQDVYGLPDWLGGLQSALLNENATLFRRKYFVNGAHCGNIFYTNDPNLDEDTEEAFMEAVKSGKGIGNFKSQYIHIPGGDEKAIQVIPIGDIGKQDEFRAIKEISSQDVIVAHRVPPQLASVKPEKGTSMGDLEKVERIYVKTEVKALAQLWIDANDVHDLPANLQIKFEFPNFDEVAE